MRDDELRRELDRIHRDIAGIRSSLGIAFLLIVVALAGYLVENAGASPRVTPAQAERAAASWTRWYWSAANEDMGGGYVVNDLAVTCERTPASTRRWVRCAATYYVTDPTDAAADVGSFEDFHRVCVARKVAKAAHAIAAPDARIARTTLLVRRKRDGSGVVLDCRYISFREGRYS